MKEIIMPPSRACSICKNQMGETCLTNCAPAGDYKYFNPDLKIPFELVPKLTFSEYNELTGSMKGKWLFVMVSKIQEVCDGSDNDRSRSRRILKDVKIKNLLPDPEAGVTSHQDGEERTDTAERTD